MRAHIKMNLAPRKVFSAQEKYEDFLKHLPETTSDKTLMALKGHLLVEQALREFVGKRVAKPDRIKETQIQFSTLLDFASSLDDGDSMSWVWVATRKLNKLRNQLAHNLSPQKIEALEQDFINYVRHHDGEMNVSVGSAELKYTDFPLAIFQIYDRIFSYPYASPATIERLNSVITNSFLALGPLDQFKSNNFRHGPKQRKKWSK
jgi:hypothetical protein